MPASTRMQSRIREVLDRNSGRGMTPTGVTEQLGYKPRTKEFRTILTAVEHQMKLLAEEGAIECGGGRVYRVPRAFADGGEKQSE